MEYISFALNIMEASPNLPTPSGSVPASGFKIANVPKVTYQDPQSISTNYAWGLPIDFVLPSTIGKVVDLVLQIDVTQNATASAAVLPATPYWFERLETSIGGSAPFETVNKDELWQETVEFLENQDLLNIAPSINFNPANSAVSGQGVAIPNDPSGNKVTRYFLPLWANCMMTAQPYLRGFQSQWKLRFVLSNNQPTISGTGVVNVTGIRLLITEAQLPPNIEARLAHQHSKGIVYNTVNRVRHIDTKGLAAGDQEFTLTTFGNESAGLLCYIRQADNSSDYTKLGLRAPVSYINLRDAQGNPYYATNLDGQFNQVFLTPWSINRESEDGTRPAVYLIPFSAHLGAVLEDGRDLGAYALSGKEKAVLSLSAANITNLSTIGMTTPVFVAVSYDYMRIKVKNGQARVSYNRN